MSGERPETAPEIADPKPREQAVIDHYLVGASLRSTAREFGVSPSWVLTTLVRAGIPRRAANRPIGSGERYTRRPHSRDPAIVAYYLAGFTLRQTAARFGLTF